MVPPNCQVESAVRDLRPMGRRSTMAVSTKAQSDVPERDRVKEKSSTHRGPFGIAQGRLRGAQRKPYRCESPVQPGGDARLSTGKLGSTAVTTVKGASFS